MVSAAVRVVFPWSTCPMVPTSTCGFSLSNFSRAARIVRERPREVLMVILLLVVVMMVKGLTKEEERFARAGVDLERKTAVEAAEGGGGRRGRAHQSRWS